MYIINFELFNYFIRKKIPLFLSDSIHFLFIFLGGCFLFYHTNFWQNVYYLSLYQ